MNKSKVFTKKKPLLPNKMHICKLQTPPIIMRATQQHANAFFSTFSQPALLSLVRFFLSAGLRRQIQRKRLLRYSVILAYVAECVAPTWKQRRNAAQGQGGRTGPATKCRRTTHTSRRIESSNSLGVVPCTPCM